MNNYLIKIKEFIEREKHKTNGIEILALVSVGIILVIVIIRHNELYGGLI